MQPFPLLLYLCHRQLKCVHYARFHNIILFKKFGDQRINNSKRFSEYRTQEVEKKRERDADISEKERVEEEWGERERQM